MSNDADLQLDLTGILLVGVGVLQLLCRHGGGGQGQDQEGQGAASGPHGQGGVEERVGEGGLQVHDELQEEIIK